MMENNDVQDLIVGFGSVDLSKLAPNPLDEVLSESNSSTRQAQEDMKFDNHLKEWAQRCAAKLFKDVDMFVPSLHQIKTLRCPDKCAQFRAVWTDICLNYCLIWDDYSSFISEYKTASKIDELDAGGGSFETRTRILGQVQAFVLRYRALWDKVMNAIVLSMERPDAEKVWYNTKEKSAKNRFAKTLALSSGKFPEWVAKVVVSELLDCFDNMFRTAEVHRSGTLRTWALASTLSVETIDLMSVYLSLTTTLMRVVQHLLNTGESIFEDERSAFYSSAVELMALAAGSKRYADTYMLKLSEQAVSLAKDNSIRLKVAVFVHVKLYERDRHKESWRKLLERLEEVSRTYPDATQISRLQYEVQRTHWHELPVSKLYAVVHTHLQQALHKHQTKSDDGCSLPLNPAPINIFALDAANLYDHAFSLSERRLWADSAASYKELYTRFPTKHRALVGQARCLTEQGNFLEALELLDQYQKHCPAEIHGTYARCVILTRQELYDEAYTLALSLLKLDCNFAEGWDAMGTILMYRGDYGSVVKCLTRALTLNMTGNTSLNILYTRALAYFRMEQWQEAAADCLSALQIDPNDNECKLLRARALHHVDSALHCKEIARLAAAHTIACGSNWIFKEGIVHVPNIPVVRFSPIVFYTNVIEIRRSVQVAQFLDSKGLYRESLDVWLQLFDSVNDWVGTGYTPQLIMHSVFTRLYWTVRCECVVNGKYGLDCCDECLLVYNNLLEELNHPAADKDVQLHANIHKQIGLIRYSKATYTNDPTERNACLVAAVESMYRSMEMVKSRDTTLILEGLRWRINDPAAPLDLF